MSSHVETDGLACPLIFAAMRGQVFSTKVHGAVRTAISPQRGPRAITLMQAGRGGRMLLVPSLSMIRAARRAPVMTFAFILLSSASLALGQTQCGEATPVIGDLDSPEIQPQEPQAAQHEMPESYPLFHILGFTDFDYDSIQERKGSSSGFFEGQFVLHFTSRLSERFTYFAEVSTTARNDQFRTEIERTILKYDHSDRLKLSVGRYHTPINYWNVAFHHGQFLQTTISRPEMVRFGGEFVPVHFVGGLLEGSVPANGLNLNYNFAVGNGRSSVLSRPGDAGDVNNSRAVTAGVFVKPDRFYGLRLGTAVYVDRITVGAASYDERIIAAHAAWTHETPEVIGEYARVTHRRDGGGSDFGSNAYYIQLAYRLSPSALRLKPYVRYERIRIDRRDRIFSQIAPIKLLTTGVRYDVSDVVALKAEYRRDSMKRLYEDAIFAQVSFTF